MKKLFTGIALVITFTAISQTKPGYSIQFNVQGLKDTTAYLGYYYAESTYVRDTAKVNGKGVFVFDGKQALPQGVYFLVLDKTRLFDMVIGTNQHFVMETNTSDYIKNMVVKSDLDNKLFFENMVFNNNLSKEAEPHIQVLQDSTLKEEDKKDAREAYLKISEKATAYQNTIIDQHPTTLTARLFKSTKQVQIPDPPKKADGSIDSTFQLKY